MNKVYALRFCNKTGTLVPIPEVLVPKSKRRQSRSAGRVAVSSFALLILSLLQSEGALALPAGGQVASGQVSIQTPAPNVMKVVQGSQTAIINWQSFGVAVGESVNFQQPGVSSIALNRVLSGNASTIYGALTSNGTIFLVNPSGVLFAPGASVNVGGIVASTLDITDQSFLSGQYHFSGASPASVVNQGSISTSRDGVVAMIGNQVTNSGTIKSPKGSVALGAGGAVDMTLAGNSMVSFQVSQSAVNAAVANGGAIKASSGQVILSASAANAVLQTVVNNTGVIKADSVSNDGGTITLLGGDAGVVEVSGVVAANSGNANGGSVTIGGQSVSVNAGAKISAKGKTGGGSVTIGAARGAQSAATTTTVNQGATIDASATGNGNGGTITVISDLTNSAAVTTVTGSLIAKGGASGGHGGQIETSGATLNASGASVDASAAKGAGGQWLLDPTMVEITASTTSGTTSSTSGGTTTVTGSGTSYISADTIDTALNAGTNVMVETTGLANSGAFDVWLVSPIQMTGSGAATLTLQAANSVYVGAPISSTGGPLTVNLYSGNNGGTLTGSGAVMLAANITTNGGNINFGTNGTISGVLSGGNVYVNSQLQQGGGGSATNQLITLDTTSASTNGGNVNVYGQLVIANPSGFTINTQHTGASGTDGNVMFAGTVDSGNTFAYVSASDTWYQAYTAAQSGAGGNVGDTYLATPNTALLNAVASFAANYGQAWLGGERLMAPTVTGAPSTATNQAALDNVWYWVSGPLGLVVNASSPTGYGTAFFTQHGSTTSNYPTGGTAIGTAYANWNPGTPEPNNSSGANLTPAGASEWAMQFVGSAGQWNDLNPTTNHLAYVTETNLAGAPLTVNSGSGSITLQGGVGTNQPLMSFNVTGNVINLPSNPSINTTNGTNITSPNVNVGGTPTTLLTIAATNEVSNYGATQLANLPLTYTISGQTPTSTAPSGVTPGSETWSVTPTSASNIGIYTDTPSGANAGSTGYTIMYSSGNLTINPAQISVTGLSANARAYNGLNSVILSGTSTLTGLLNTDSGTLSGTASATVPSANVQLSGGVAQPQTVTVAGLSFTLTSGTAADYTFVQPTGLTAIITPAMLTVTGLAPSSASQTYNSTSTVALSGTPSFGGLVGGQTLTVTGLSTAGTAASANVGSQAVTADLTLGNGSGLATNYTVAPYSVGSVTITPATLSVSGEAVANKVYNGNTTATLSGGTLVGVVSGDTVTLTQAGTFASQNVGTGITVAASDSLGGGSAGNYTLTQPGGLSANITPATLTVSGETVANKVYNGSTAATLSGGMLVGVVSGDTVTLTQAGTFASQNAGTGITVMASDSLGGGSAGNYTLTQPTGLSANITPATLSVSGLTSSNMTYNGTLNDPLAVDPVLGSVALNGLVSGETLTVLNSGFGTLSNANAGTRSVATNLQLMNGSGLASNYTLVQPTLPSVTVSPAPLTISGIAPTSSSQTYNGSTAVALSGTPSVSGLVSGQTVTIQSVTGAAASANAGSETVTATVSFGNGSALATNYTIAPYSVGNVSITPATLSVSGEAVANKVYNGNTTATLSGGTLAGIVSGDTVTLTQAGNFASPNAANGITVMASDSLGGTAAGNYTLTQPSGLSANITPATLSVSGEAVANKVYNGSTAAILSGGTLVGVVSGDTVTLTQAGTFASQNVGTGITVMASDSLGGTAAGNYTLTQPSGLSANITPATLSVSGEAVANKVYNGSTAATLSGGTLVGVVSGDTVTLTQAGTFASQNAGTGITVMASDSLGGTAAGNYTLTQPSGLTARITPAILTVGNVEIATKTDDGTSAATVVSSQLEGVVAGDVVSLVTIANVDPSAVGLNVPATFSDVLVGSGAGNYQIQQPVGITVTVLPTPENVVPPIQGGDVSYGPTAPSSSSTASLGTGKGGLAVNAPSVVLGTASGPGLISVSVVENGVNSPFNGLQVDHLTTSLPTVNGKKVTFIQIDSASQ